MPNPQVCMFCRYRRALVDGRAQPCGHLEDKPAPAALRGAPPRPGPMLAQRRGLIGAVARRS